MSENYDIKIHPSFPRVDAGSTMPDVSGKVSGISAEDQRSADNWSKNLLDIQDARKWRQ